MGDEHPIRTLGDYSRPSHEGYKNTIELLEGNSVVPLRSDTIRLVQNECSFHGLRSEDPNQHLKNFLKLVDSLDLDSKNRERTRLRLFQFSLRDQASNWIERLPSGSIFTWEDLTTRFLAQFFPPGRTAKLRNDILMFKQHHGESLSEAWTRFKDLFQKVPHHGIDRWLQIQIFYDHVSFHLKCEIDRAGGGVLRNKNADESWEIIKNLSLCDHEGWTKVTPDNVEKLTEAETETPVMEVEKINEVENGAKLIKTSENEEAVEAPGSQPVAYYLKHKINEKLIKGLVNNNRFNNSRSRTQAGKKKGKEYKVLPGGPAYDAILKKMITKKEDIGGNFEIPCSLGNLKHVNALVDQGSDVNVMPYSTYTKLTDEKPAETDIRLSLASHSYIYPLGIAEDVLVEIAEHVYPVDFVILDIRENENRPFILGTPFLTTAKASIKFDTGTITLRLVLEWEEKIKLHLEREMQFNQWRSKNFKGMHPTLIATKEEEEDEGEVTLYLMRRSMEVLRKFHWMILGRRFNQLSHVSSPLLSKPWEYWYFSFGRHLDELHVTWAHLKKKRTRLQTNTKTLEDLCSQSLETASQAIHDVVTTLFYDGVTI
ncbi:zinc finger, CCHC-type containing protein [Tanacetum coccineum]